MSSIMFKKDDVVRTKRGHEFIIVHVLKRFGGYVGPLLSNPRGKMYAFGEDEKPVKVNQVRRVIRQ